MRKPTPSDIWGGAPADEGVVPMILLITREKREGPLGSGGSLEEGTQDIAENGYSSASRDSELTSTCMCAPNSGFEAYLKPKGKGICEMPHLKPERGNLAFRNFRGLSRNGLLGFPLMDVNSIIKQFKVEPRRTALLFYSVEVARLQGLVGKAGSIRVPPRAKKGKVCGGMRNANATSGNGDSDQVIVPMTAMITSGERKGPVDTAVAGSGRERPILRKGYRGQTNCR
ncbi:MAG: hypothetical protein ACYCPR_09010 [Thermoplasmataceae archaeon]